MYLLYQINKNHFQFPSLSISILCQVIELFILEAPKYINDFKSSCSDNNWPDLYKYSHKLKPSIEILGFPTEMTEALININLLQLVKFKTMRIKPV
jgi:hypothetical protein